MSVIKEGEAKEESERKIRKEEVTTMRDGRTHKQEERTPRKSLTSLPVPFPEDYVASAGQVLLILHANTPHYLHTFTD